jgi:transcriptional regulator with XRE-family HTH domain
MSVGVSTISRLERGVQPIRIYRLPALASTLDTSLADLFKGS